MAENKSLFLPSQIGQSPDVPDHEYRALTFKKLKAVGLPKERNQALVNKDPTADRYSEKSAEGSRASWATQWTKPLCLQGAMNNVGRQQTEQHTAHSSFRAERCNS